jgi:hypothetical protein
MNGVTGGALVVAETLGFKAGSQGLLTTKFRIWLFKAKSLLLVRGVLSIRSTKVGTLLWSTCSMFM